jgi:hypothetical protein
MSQKPTEYELRDAELLLDRVSKEYEKLEDGKISLEEFGKFVADVGDSMKCKQQRQRLEQQEAAS